MLPIQTGHRENGNGPRLVIARPQRGRGNLREALAARTNRRQNGKRHQACHCEGASRPWQSRGGSCVFADGFPAIQPGTARLPRRFAPRNDTSGGCGGAPELSSGLMPLCKAVTDRRYRRNWSVRFIDALYELQVPSRDCHVALLLAMTRQAGAAVHQRPHAVECSPTGRSLSAATDAIGPCVLSTPCTDCKCVAGHGCPLPCKGVCSPCNFFSFPLIHSVI